MAKKRYKFAKLTDEQLDKLAEKFPKAVKTTTKRVLVKPITGDVLDIIEKEVPDGVRTETKRSLDYGVVSKLLDCGVAVPEVKQVEDEVAEENEKASKSVPKGVPEIQF